MYIKGDHLFYVKNKKKKKLKTKKKRSKPRVCMSVQFFANACVRDEDLTEKILRGDRTKKKYKTFEREREREDDWWLIVRKVLRRVFFKINVSLSL